MPASAGRVRMPHNNRMSTSATLKTHSIWQTAIGHDPYANAAEKEESARDTKADAEKLEKVMEMAKSQNVTDSRNTDNNFTAKMFRGLKRGKQRRGDAQRLDEFVDPKLQGLLDDPSSSSEEEFVEVEVKKEKKKKPSKKKDRQKRKRRSSSSSRSSDDSLSDDESSSDRYERKRKREKRRKRKKKSHKRSSHDSYDYSSDSEDNRRRRKERRRRSEDKKRSRREH